MKPWYVYMIRCEDNSLYTGVATDVKKRYDEHVSGVGAKYTRSHKPLKIEKYLEVSSRSEACVIESFIKKMSKKQKEFLLLNTKKLKEEIKIKKNIDVLQIM